MTTFEARIIFEVAGEVGKIGLSLKPNHYNQVKVKLVQIPNTFVYTNDITDYAYLRLIRCKFFPFKIEKFFIFFSQNLFIFCTILFTKTDRKLQVWNVDIKQKRNFNRQPPYFITQQFLFLLTLNLFWKLFLFCKIPKISISWVKLFFVVSTKGYSNNTWHSKGVGHINCFSLLNSDFNTIGIKQIWLELKQGH